MDTNFEIFLGNFSFLILLISMFIYWIQVSNFENDNSKVLVPLVSSGELGDPHGIPSIQKINILNNKDKVRFIATISTMIANASLFLLLIFRWKESGHFPLSNLYESLMFLSWSLTLIHLIIELGFYSSFNPPLFNIKYGESSMAGSKIGIMSDGGTPKEGDTPDELLIDQRKAFITTRLIGSITAPSALFTNAFATFSLPKEMQEAAPLVPALQSNWLMMHVTVMILSYSALILGSLLSIGFLVISGNKDINLDSKEILFKDSYRFNLAKTLDNLSYRVLGLGFPLLTIGILSGAVWANEAWGSYWSWDPKETWALLTWLVFAIYLHTRLTKGWEGKKPALIASLGFVTVWICFLGVNLIGEGLHSYGWMSQS